MSTSDNLIATVRYYLLPGAQVRMEVETADGEKGEQIMPEYMAMPMLNMLGVSP